MQTARTLGVWTLLIGAVACAVGQARATDERQEAERDRIRIAVQAICPVSGQKLGEHGSPVKVKVGKEILFLCCRGCLGKKIEPRHWATIHQNFAKAQRICPVMKHTLPKNPKWTVVDGQIIYVCCPPCTEKISAEPKSYLRKIEQLYVAALKERPVR